MARNPTTYLTSPVAEVSALRFHPLPTRPINVARACRVNGAHVVVTEDGTIYTSQVDTTSSYRTASRFMSTMTALQRMQVLSPAAVHQHELLVKQEAEADHKHYAAKNVLREMATTGVILSPEQLAQLERLAQDPEEEF